MGKGISVVMFREAQHDTARCFAARASDGKASDSICGIGNCNMVNRSRGMCNADQVLQRVSSQGSIG
eukprot:1684649-Alexandrium_andersonii.AAC.1